MVTKRTNSQTLMDSPASARPSVSHTVAKGTVTKRVMSKEDKKKAKQARAAARLGKASQDGTADFASTESGIEGGSGKHKKSLFSRFKKKNETFVGGSAETGVNADGRVRRESVAQNASRRELPPAVITALHLLRVYFRKILIVALSIILVVLIAITVLSTTTMFTIETLIVKGASHLTDIEMVELANVPEGSTLLNVDTDTIKQRLLLDTWVEDVTVSRVFPDALCISVKERKINAVAEIPQQNGRITRMWALSEDGLWIMPIPDKDSEAAALVSPQIYADCEKVLHIIDIPYGTQPEIGTYCTDEYVNNALHIVSSLSTTLSEKVVTVKATEAANTTLILDDGVEIAFGAATDVRDKERVCLELLKKYEGQIAYINVSVVDSPTWRSI